jgi:uncharacterized membrane protein YfcA
MEIFRYILFLGLFLAGMQVNAAEQTSLVTAFTADSVRMLHSVFSTQYILLLILLIIGVVLGALWRRRFHIEDIGWIIVVITLSMGFACVLLRVKLGA